MSETLDKKDEVQLEEEPKVEPRAEEVKEKKVANETSPLVELRGRKGQQYVAKRAGISQPLLSALEHNEKPITVWAAERLAKVLGEDVWKLVDEDADDITGTISAEEAGERMDPPHSKVSVNVLCREGRIPGAEKKKVATPHGTQLHWRIPEKFEVLPPTTGWRRTLEEKNQIVNEYKEGATGRQLAAKYDIDPSYPSILMSRGFPKEADDEEPDDD